MASVCMFCAIGFCWTCLCSRLAVRRFGEVSGLNSVRRCEVIAPIRFHTCFVRFSNRDRQYGGIRLIYVHVLLDFVE
jgi:hypothetical protein